MIVIFSILASLNLPAAIEDLSGSADTVPQSVLDKAKDIKDKGGLGAIDHLMQNLPDLLTRNREVLDEVRVLYVIGCEFFGIRESLGPTKLYFSGYL